MRLRDVPVPEAFRDLRRHALDDAVLLFDRATGVNVLCDGPEYAGLRRQSPRVVQFAITNRCNLACHFCSRDTTASSRWTAASAFAFLQELAERGVLEVAFGGGEPLVFPGFVDLVRRLHTETPLAVNLTTNGLRLTPSLLAELAPVVGQLRLSLYDDNDWRRRVRDLADSAVRFGVNHLVTPERLEALETVVLELVELGCTDILLLSYNGTDRSLHLDPAATQRLDAMVALLSVALHGRVRLCLDVCWGDRLQRPPALFDTADCGAGHEFIVVTSDRKVMPCSFHDLAVPIDTVDDLLATWRALATERPAATQPGCARVADFGLSPGGASRITLERRR